MTPKPHDTEALDLAREAIKMLANAIYGAHGNIEERRTAAAARFRRAADLLEAEDPREPLIYLVE